MNANITVRTRLSSVEEFRNVLIRVNPDGSRILLGDIARVELGGESELITAFFNGNQTSGFAIRPATGANALETVSKINRNNFV